MRAGFSEVGNTVFYKAGPDRPGFRTGDILSVKIIKNNNGLIKALIQGKIINLKGGKDLPEGKIFKVRAEWSGKTLLLNRLDPEAGMERMLKTVGLKNDNLSYLLLETARRSGLHLNDENLRILKKLIRKKTGMSRKDARFAVESIKKGLDPEGLVEDIENLKENVDGNNEKKLLFNHLKDGNELWFIVPFRFVFEDEAIGGSLRIKKNTDSGRIQSFVIEAEYKKKALYFVIDKYQAAEKVVRILYEGTFSKKEKKGFKRELPEILGNMKFKIDDNIIEHCMESAGGESFFDGFSVSEVSAFSGIEELI